MERNRAGSINIARVLVTQIAKNVLMGSSFVRNWRLKRPRTATHHTDIDGFLGQYAFASLDLLRENVGDPALLKYPCHAIDMRVGNAMWWRRHVDGHCAQACA